jgi:hypothetical protein
VNPDGALADPMGKPDKPNFGHVQVRRGDGSRPSVSAAKSGEPTGAFGPCGSARGNSAHPREALPRPGPVAL